MVYKFQAFVLTLLMSAVLSFADNSQVTQRQGIAGASSGILSTLGSMVPGVVSNLLPMVFLFGLGALMVPALGLGLLLREGRRSEKYYYNSNYRSFPTFNINTASIMDGVSDIFEKVIKAIDNVDKKYK